MSNSKKRNKNNGLTRQGVRSLDHLVGRSVGVKLEFTPEMQQEEEKKLLTPEEEMELMVPEKNRRFVGRK
jgi:hypothetical protein